MVGYFRDYVWNMSMRTKFLRSLLQKDIPFVWSSNHEAKFQDLKTNLVSLDLMLYHPDFDKAFEGIQMSVSMALVPCWLSGMAMY